MDGALAMTDRLEIIVAHLIRHADPTAVPASAHAAAKTWIIDSVGVALAGTSVAQSGQLLAAARQWGRADDASIWGSDERLTAASAALVNAFHLHNQEFDCVHEKAVVHPMAVILPSLFAYAEKCGGVSGQRLTAALSLAVDVAAVVGLSATQRIRFFRPAMCGCLGAAAGLAVLAGLNAAQIRNAMGLAYSQLAGTMQAHVEGTPTLALQVGFAARAATSAVDLATQGFSAPHHIFDGTHGYFTLYEPNAAPEFAFAELGNIWQIERVSHKPFPTGRAAQGGIAGLRALMQQHHFSADEVEQIVVIAPPLVLQLVDRPMQPAMSVNYSRLCMPFLLATVLKHGNVDLGSYRDERMSDAALASLAQRVSMRCNGSTDVNALRPQRIEVTLIGGQRLSLDIPYVYGAPEAPMSLAEQRQKFFHCCEFARSPLSSDAVTLLWQQLGRIENVPDVAALISLTHPHLGVCRV
jgi:aconitate decarboxylase